MTPIGRQRAQAERAAAGVLVDRVAVRAARQRLTALARAKLAPAALALGAFAGGIVAGRLARSGRPSDHPEEARASRGRRLHVAAAVLFRLLELYARRRL